MTLHSRIGIVSLAAVVSSGVPAVAQQSATIKVSSTVVRNCTITASPLAFGNYDPVVANSTTPLTSQTNVRVRCTKGLQARVLFNLGQNGGSGSRRMKGPGTDFLNYELFGDTSYATPLGNGDTNRLNITAAPNFQARDYAVYGRVPQAQDVGEGVYQDEIIATVEF